MSQQYPDSLVLHKFPDVSDVCDSCLHIPVCATKDAMLGDARFSGEKLPVMCAVAGKVYPSSIVRSACQEVNVTRYVAWGIDDVQAAVTQPIKRFRERPYRAPCGVVGRHKLSALERYEVGGDIRVWVDGVSICEESARALPKHERRVGEWRWIADVIEMHVRDADVLDVLWGQAAFDEGRLRILRHVNFERHLFKAFGCCWWERLAPVLADAEIEHDSLRCLRVT